MHDPEGPEAGHCDEPADVADPAEPAATSETDSEDEVAEAEARAEAARARLAQLRRTAETGDSDSRDAKRRLAKLTRTRPRWLRRPGRKAVALGVGVVLAGASAGATGYMLWQHHTAVHQRQLTAEVSAAAREGVTALMSIDPAHARDCIQRLIDASTGDFKNEISALSVLMVQKAQDTKVGSTVTVEAVAVESLGDDSGVALVAAKTDPIGPDNAKPPPALFRLSVNLNRDAGQLKMSKVDFLQ